MVDADAVPIADVAQQLVVLASNATNNSTHRADGVEHRDVPWWLMVIICIVCLLGLIFLLYIWIPVKRLFKTKVLRKKPEEEEEHEEEEDKKEKDIRRRRKAEQEASDSDFSDVEDAPDDGRVVDAQETGGLQIELEDLPVESV